MERQQVQLTFNLGPTINFLETYEQVSEIYSTLGQVGKKMKTSLEVVILEDGRRITFDGDLMHLSPRDLSIIRVKDTKLIDELCLKGKVVKNLGERIPGYMFDDSTYTDFAGIKIHKNEWPNKYGPSSRHDRVELAYTSEQYIISSLRLGDERRLVYLNPSVQLN